MACAEGEVLERAWHWIFGSELRSSTDFTFLTAFVVIFIDFHRCSTFSFISSRKFSSPDFIRLSTQAKIPCSRFARTCLSRSIKADGMKRKGL